MYGTVLDFGDQSKVRRAGPCRPGSSSCFSPYGLDSRKWGKNAVEGPSEQTFHSWSPSPAAFEAVARLSKTLRPEGRESPQFVFNGYSG